MDFVDRLLTCADCRQNFIFTAGEQLFFLDKQFKNDPKRCKPCKSRRAGMVATAGGAPVATGLSRTETRTFCSDCKVETTVPFKPTQGRPVLCRQCFQAKRSIPPVPLVIAHGDVSAAVQDAAAELVAAASNEAAARELNPAMVEMMASASQA